MSKKNEIAILIYDSGCSFCTGVALWLQNICNGVVCAIPNSSDIAVTFHPSLTLDTIKKDVHIVYKNKLYSGGGVLACVLGIKLKSEKVVKLYIKNVVVRSIMNGMYKVAKRLRYYLSYII
jgi:predicted DCC family thiol-disulfide oxidoreductase YuxK